MNPTMKYNKLGSINPEKTSLGDGQFVAYATIRPNMIT